MIVCLIRVLISGTRSEKNTWERIYEECFFLKKRKTTPNLVVHGAARLDYERVISICAFYYSGVCTFNFKKLLPEFFYFLPLLSLRTKI